MSAGKRKSTQSTVIEGEIKKQLGFLDPLKILNSWLKLALKVSSVRKDNAWFMVLSSSYKNEVSSRVVLLKELNQKGEAVFYSNYLSRKGQQIAKNSKAALNFYWPELNKQVRLEGSLLKTSRQKSLQYWKSRSRQSQISQWLSKQSQKIFSKKELLDLKEKAEQRFKNKAIPCPAHWGGYRLKIKKIEFWIEGKDRLHDRFLFEKTGKKSKEKSRADWKIQRLFP